MKIKIKLEVRTGFARILIPAILIILISAILFASCTSENKEENKENKDENITTEEIEKPEYDGNIPERAVVVDYGKKTGTATPYVFGMVKNDDNSTSKLIQKELNNIDVTWIKKSLWLELMLPESFVPDIEYWENNKNGCKNIDSWRQLNPSLIDALIDAKQSNCKVMLLVSYTPPFLAYNRNWNGVPKDWKIYEEIVKAAIAKYKDYVDLYEIWNEYSHEWLDIAGSPYATKHEAYQDIYLHSAKAIREIVPDAIIGGPATAMGGDTGELESLLNNPAFTPESNLLNFVSFHEYTNKDVTWAADAYKKILEDKGFKDIPIYLDEWNSSVRGEFYANRYGVSFIGRTLISLMKKNIGAAYYNASYLNNSWNDDFGICEYDAAEKKIYGKPLINAFKIAGARLGLSKGDYELMETDAGNTTDSAGIINSEGKKVVYMANDSSIDINVSVVLKNIEYTGQPVCKTYVASTVHDGNAGVVLACNYYKNTITTTVTIPSYGVAGIVVDDDFEYAPEDEDEEGEESDSDVPVIINPGFEDGYYSWECSGGISGNEARTGKYCTTVTAGCSSEQIIYGLKPDSGYRLSAYIKAEDGGVGCLGAKDMGTGETSVSYRGEEYELITVEFKTGANNASAKIFIFNPNFKGIIYADDFSIEPVG